MPAAPGRSRPPEPPNPTLDELLARLGVAKSPLADQRRAASQAAFGGVLRPVELATLRRAGLIPYDWEAAERAASE